MNVRLWTERFIPTSQRALHARNIHTSDCRVQGVCEALLYDLKFVRWIDEKIA